MEIWKIVKSAPNYEVSNLGSVRNTKTGKTLKIATNNSGYKLVCLSHRNQRQTGYIHRLVAEAFIKTDLDTNTSIVNHIDGDKSNNTIENLEWSNYSENAYHGKARLKVKAKEVSELLEILEKMDLCQINKAISICKSILR
jgi:hypothetical protein